MPIFVLLFPKKIIRALLNVTNYYYYDPYFFFKKKILMVIEKNNIKKIV